MIDVIKKAILAGVGAAALTKEKIDEALVDLVEKGKLSASDAKDAAKKIADQGKQEFESASAKVQEKFADMVSSANRKQSDRIDALETRVAELEARLGEKKTVSSE